VNGLDYAILLGTLVAIAAVALWSTRGQLDLKAYLKGSGRAGWFTIGVSVMATQASAVTFLSMPGQGFQDGLGFVQNYFGAPFALILISAVILPIYRRLQVYTAYEYLGRRFDAKTRLLGAGLFLLQRGLGAGITIYAPAIVLSTVMGWRLDVTIIGSGLFVVGYTVAGGCDAVSLTQKYQLGIIFIGLLAALGVLLHRLPANLGVTGALTLAGRLHRLGAVDFSPSLARRYTFWSGLLGGLFLALSYFGTDQSQVQRYLGGASLRESRLGLMFNAVGKIPMQVFILLLGVLIFVFYRFERSPVYFARATWQEHAAGPEGAALRALAERYGAAHDAETAALAGWREARGAGDAAAAEERLRAAQAAQAAADQARADTQRLIGRGKPASDADYVFIDFILDYLPHGLIGLLVTAFFAAALSSKAGELNALGSTTTVDLYQHLVGTGRPDAHYVLMSRVFTALWGLVAIGFALMAHLSENLIQAVNILGSLFYGVVLGIFLLAFFVRWVGGTAAFWGALAAQALVFGLYFTLPISYLWYNVIGCAACMGAALALQAVAGSPPPASAAAPA